MNKDVIYVEPEDDITDIILKIEKSKEKIVALVPPKKAGVFRSVVNIKLIAKAGATSEKTVVLVTVDPSIMKLAAATKIPVAKNLQSAPVIPAVEAEGAEDAEKDELVEESDGTVETEEDVEDLKPSKSDKDKKKKRGGKDDDDDDEEDEEEDDEDEEEEPKKKKTDKKKTTKSGNKLVNWIKGHKKTAIIGGIGILVLIAALVWALAIAPAVTITVGIKTTSNNFSENVSFTNNLNDEKASEGVFYLEEVQVESVEKVEFEATGKKNVGEKASGEVVVYAYFKEKGTIQVSSGSSFTFNGLNFVSNGSASLSWNGEDADDCENNGEASAITSGCLISGRVNVTAAEAGSKYNVAASNSGWNTTAPVAVYSDKAMSGGTDQEITVVQQSDVERAKAELAAANESENKEELSKKIGENKMAIDASFKQETAAAVAKPAVGEEVKDGVKPTLEATTTARVYVLDKTKVEEFITEKANLGDAQKIYEMKDPFVENFMQISSGYTGKLKTSYMTGPKITENDVVEKTKGRGLGEAQHDLRDIEGVASVTIDKSVPWVMTVPNDANKITVIFEVKDQNGNRIDQNENKEDKGDENKDGEEKEDESKEEES